MTTPETALSIVERSGISPGQPFTEADIALLRDLIAKDTSPGEFSIFVKVCEATGLNPFAKQIYAIKYGGRMTIQTSIDGFRLIAQRTGEYTGQVGPMWCGPDGEWRDIWLDDEPPFAAKVGVNRTGFSEPLWATARWKTFAQHFNNKLAATWEKMPDLMLAKCAEAQALRRAFPHELSALYTDDEMAAPRRAARRPAAITAEAQEQEQAQEAPQPKRRAAGIGVKEDAGISDNQRKAIRASLHDLWPKDEQAQWAWVKEIEPTAVDATTVHLTGLSSDQASRIITALNDERAGRNH